MEYLIPALLALAAFLAGGLAFRRKKTPPVQIDKTDYAVAVGVEKAKMEEVGAKDADLTEDVEVTGGAAQWDAIRKLRGKS